MSTANEGRCCDAVIRIIEQRMNHTRRICSVDTAATPGVDVRSKIGGQIYALEHTTLDPYPGRRADDQRFLAVLEPLENSIEETGLIPSDCRYKLHVDIHAFRQFRKSDFARIRAQLQTWVLENHNQLVPPRVGRAAVLSGGPPDLPVRVLLHCFNASGAMRGKVSLCRLAPENLEDLRQQRLHEALSKKGPKLQAEHDSGSTSVLVLEDFDIALSNEIVIGDAVHGELDESGYCVDEVYLVDTTSTMEWMVLLLKHGDSRWPTESESPPMWPFIPSELSDLTSRHC